ncbi:hypothetical protein AO384_1328 [Moraxella catarrhalis]|uniref:Uncharacterized protein n=1 Tax=Moraxella catarrhalis TaxID=480 RepID=A0A198UKF3_MORCA|nr:hypothetical protein AO384_1328 [Moraxella catarrhalis]OAU97473.1 hypothetical protein AO383_1033 [Moraxella catarrhalis]OAV00738.1 hypothetical protein AO382_1172 [Moraxella catarrhalis]
MWLYYSSISKRLAPYFHAIFLNTAVHPCGSSICPFLRCVDSISNLASADQWQKAPICVGECLQGLMNNSGNL